MIHTLMIYPFQIIAFLALLLVTVVSALVLASKNETRFHFLIWAGVILLFPFIGAISYLIKHFSGKKMAEKVVN